MTDIYVRLTGGNPELLNIDPLNILGPSLSLKLLEGEEIKSEKLNYLNRKIWENIRYILKRDFNRGDIFLAHLHSDNILEKWLTKNDVEKYLWGKESLLQGPDYFWNSDHELLKFQTQSDILNLPSLPDEKRKIRFRNYLRINEPEKMEKFHQILYDKIQDFPEDKRYIFYDEVTKDYILRVLEYPKYISQSSFLEFH